MQKRGGEVLFSAGDVVAFLECEHATTLALTDLETPLPRAEDDASLELIQQKGFAHEAGFLSSLKSKGTLCWISRFRNPPLRLRSRERSSFNAHMFNRRKSPRGGGP